MRSFNRYRFGAHQSGVTLMELMVVMVIVGILAAIAYPSYRAQVIRTHRTEGRAALMQTAQQLERCYTRASTYVDCANDNLPYDTDNGLYRITVDDDLDVNAYTLIATPLGGQLQDAPCLQLKLDQANRRTPPACW